MSAPYLGDFLDNQTVHFMWSSNGANGASITRATNGTVSVYKDNGTTQTTTGVTDTEDFDALTGIHVCTIATTDAFYATGSNYTVVLSAATIDGLTVNAVLAHFSIQNRCVASVTGAVGSVTGAVGSVTGAVGSVTGAVGSVTGAVGSVAAGGIAAASFAAGAINAAAIAADAIGASELAADAITEIQSGLATAAALTTLDDFVDTEVAAILAAVDTEIAAIKSDTAAILLDTAEIGAAGAGLTALASQASVNTIDDFLDTEVAAILAAVDTEVAAIKAKTDNLPAAPAATGDIPTAAQNAAGLLDLAAGVETGLTLRQALRLIAAATAGKLSGGGTATEVIRNAVADTADRITATVDADGNRTAITYDLA
jgi:hypothetical protein